MNGRTDSSNACAFSPDGRFVAYDSYESGRFEVYVAAFPQPGGVWQVSQGGGVEPRWSHDGGTLYDLDLDNRLQAVGVRTQGGAFQAGAARTLFQHRSHGSEWRYDVSRDGSEFLVSVPIEPEGFAAITVMSNWTAAVLKR